MPTGTVPLDDPYGKLRFERRITLGNLIEIGVILAAVILGYAHLSENQKLMEVELNALRQETSSLRQDCVRNDIYRMEVNILNERLVGIGKQLEDIKKAVR